MEYAIHAGKGLLDRGGLADIRLDKFGPRVEILAAAGAQVVKYADRKSTLE